MAYRDDRRLCAQIPGTAVTLVDVNPERAVIAEGLKSRGASDLMIPKVLVHLDEIPLLGSGKTDYVTLTRISIEGANG